VSWQFFWLAADCAPYMRNDSCACAGTKPATPLIARCATVMRVSPFGSLAFMLPEASRISSIVRSAVLQDCAAAGAAASAMPIAMSSDGNLDDRTSSMVRLP
jgi:hypothetical protein